MQDKLISLVKKAAKSGDAKDMREYKAMYKTTQFLISIGEESATDLISSDKLQSKLVEI